MFSKFERMIAWRYLMPKKKEGFISVITTFSVLGIMLGVATLIIVMSVMNGFRTELMGRILGVNAHLTISSSYSRSIDNYESIANSLMQHADVESAVPLIQGQVLATANNKHSGAIIRGITLEGLKQKKLVSDNIVAGNINDFNNGLIIGIRMSEEMRLRPGDDIRIISPDSVETFIGDMPNLKDYKVIGVFDVGMSEYDRGTIFMPLKDAQIYFKYGDSVSSIEVRVKDKDNVVETVNELSKTLKGEYRIINWREANRDFVNALDVERNVMFLILTLILCVAGFMILSGMVMLVTSKSKEIAVLRTMGASKASIMRIFFLCGTFIGIIGTSLGFILGFSFATNIEGIRRWIESTFDTSLFPGAIYFLTKMPSETHTSDVVATISFALIISLAATIYPSWKAANISPAKGVRYE